MDALVARLGLALAVGLLVGLERGWREREAPAGSRTAGIRTYGISGLLGGVVAAVSQAIGSSAILVAGFLGFAAIFAWFKMREASDEGDYSVTGVVAGLGVFALGALAVLGDYRAAAAGGAALAGVLASREILHGLLKRLTWVELRSALALAAMTAIVLPLLPDRTIDPWGGFNPREVWFFTILVAAISFAGYVAVRVLGETRGLIVSALAGAVVSSTAVTVALARMARTAPVAPPLAGAAALAAMVSLLRVASIVLIVQPTVVAIIAPAALAAALVFGAGGTLLLMRHTATPTEAAPLRNPFEVGPLLLFALLFAVVATASAALSGSVGDAGILIASATTGTFDVDVAVLSALRQVGRAISADTAGQAVLAALLANALGRSFLAALTGPSGFVLPYIGISVAGAAAGVGTWLLMRG